MMPINLIRIFNLFPKKWITACQLTVTFSLLTYLLFSFSSIQLQRETLLENEIIDLKLQLKFLQSLYRIRQDSIQRLQKRASTSFNTQSSRLTTSLSMLQSFQQYAASLKGTRAVEGLNFTYDINNVNVTYIPQLLPHLLQHPDSIRPAYYLGSNRMFVDVVIGIPSIKRDKESYLMTTLEFLIKGLNEDDLNSTLIIVFIGETDLEYVLQVALKIELTFPNYLQMGLIEILSPPLEFYPNFDSLKPTLGDSLKRMKWRSKQNLDALFLMAHARTRGTFYLMLEDDVIASKNYVKEIKTKIREATETSPDWIVLDFSKVGGIGKLFKSCDLLQFITYVQIFYTDKPLDWLISSFLADKACTIEMNDKKCWDNINEQYSKKLPRLFKHIGLFSSLKGKVHKIPGRIKKSEGLTFYPHTNPNVTEILTDIQQVEKYSIKDAYEGIKYFWGKSVKKNNFILFKFTNPTTIERYSIRSGNIEHINDKFSHTVVEIKTKHTTDFIEVGEFDEFGIAEGEIDQKYGSLEAIRLRVTKDSPYWVLISEIEFIPRNSTK